MPSSSSRSPARSIAPPAAALRWGKGRERVARRPRGRPRPLVHLPAGLPDAGHRPRWCLSLPSRQRRQAGPRRAGASSCSAPGGARDSGLRDRGSRLEARGSGLRAQGSRAGALTSRSGKEDLARKRVGCPCRACAWRLRAAGVSPASERWALPARRWAELWPRAPGRSRASHRADTQCALI